MQNFCFYVIIKKMKKKVVIWICSCVAVLLSAILSFFWLFSVKFVSVNVSNVSGTKSEIISELNNELEDCFKKKSTFSFKEDDVRKIVEKYPDVKFLSMEKDFPDRVIVSVAERSEKYAILEGDEYYFVDDEFVYLSKGETPNGFTKIEILDSSVSFSEKSFGQTLSVKNGLFNYLNKIFYGFSDGLNTVKEIKVSEGKSRISFQTFTGVVIEFRLSSGKNGNDMTSDEKSLLVSKVPLVEERYDLLSEKEKSVGYLLVYLNNDGETKIEYSNEG